MPRAHNPNATSPWPFIGMAGLACVFFLYGASVLFLPWWTVAGLLLVWLVLLFLATAWWTPYPKRVPAVAAFAAVLWLGVVAVSAWLG